MAGSNDDNDDSTKTTAWTAMNVRRDPPLHLDEDDLDDAPVPRAFPARWVLVGLVGCGVVVALVLVVTRGSRAKRTAPAANRSAGAPAPETTSQEGEVWWTPPDAKQTPITAHAMGFPTTDERKLGVLYDKNLQPLSGEPRYLEAHEPETFPRGEMSRSLVELTNTLQLRTSFNALLVKAGVSYTEAHSYLLYRALHIAEVVAVDESKRKREPPPAAVFYLAEVHRGWSYDLLVEGEYESVGADLSAFIKVGTVSAEVVESEFSVEVHQNGLGLQASSGTAIFAMDPQQVARNYEEMDAPVPVTLVFKTIPGRSVPERKVARPKVVADQSFVLAEDERAKVSVGPGTYRIHARSKPNGIRMDIDGLATCDPALPDRVQYKTFTTNCQFEAAGDIGITNYHGLTNGPKEHASFYVARLP